MIIHPRKNYKFNNISRKSSDFNRKLFLLCFAFIIIFSGIIFLRYDDISYTVHTMLALANSNSIYHSWITYELIQIIVALCGILPASATAMGIGAAYGIVDGFFLAAPATMIGALISFGLSRTFLRGFIHRILRKSAKLDKLDQVLSAEGWKIACLFRLSPIMPFSITSYALGMSALSLRAYVIGTLASLPALLGYITMGALTVQGFSSATDASVSWVHTAILVMGGIGTVVLVWHLSRVISRILSKHIE
ncbi:TVP38/TMEM64 family protein [Komagataeibacter xylinus]|uniref:TVP38/TMEM64 family membrane protein n=1 Tax=Komagataeibacter xylinus TaxID=28448 RepID=A0A318PIG1_KOMXY|nr:VTT domain-containing protein [Komagataeibacter xylinus]PYD55492.1 TVP38/TMEM64 family protein [Komagataeibacter xylinus]